jgi:Peptidase family M48
LGTMQRGDPPKRLNRNKTVKTKNRLRFRGFSLQTNVHIFQVAIMSGILFASYDQHVLKILLAIVLSAACGLVGVPLTECLISLPRKIVELIEIQSSRKTQTPQLMSEIQGLENLMGVNVKKKNSVKIVPRWLNAAITLDGNLIIGQPVVEGFDMQPRRAILAHELAHLKENHAAKQLERLLLIGMPLCLYLFYLQLPLFITLLLVYATLGIVMPMAAWPCEYQADAIAKKYVGSEYLVSALTKMAEATDVDINRDSYSHPAISKRIEKLRSTQDAFLQ